jgi:hypothetical protein
VRPADGQRAGVVMTVGLDPLAGRHPLLGDVRPAMSAVEALTFAQLGPHGIRVVGRRPDGMPASGTIKQVLGLHAKACGMSGSNSTS